MATLESPTAYAYDHEREMPGTARGEGVVYEIMGISSETWAKWRRTVGLLLLLLTIFLWTASNFLASTIFADDTYSKPYLVTYFNTAFFIIPLIPILIQKARYHPEEFGQWRRELTAVFRRPYSPARPFLGAARYTDEEFPDQEGAAMSDSQQLLLGDDETRAGELGRTKTLDSVASTSQLPLAETARLSLEFCMLWFLANYFVAACLEYTTVASSTILTSTSSVFTLLFGALFRVERFTLKKLIGVLASLTGIILISSIDLSGRNNDDDHRGDFPSKTSWEIAVGDGLAFLSAVMYGIYAVFMKARIGDESRVNMPLFFGLVGVINLALLWPGFFILHWTGVERFALPPTGRVTAIIFANSISSLVSDIAWAYAVLLTSPIVVTVGLSMTIPLSLVGQIVLNSQTTSALYWVGAIVVVLSFIFVNHEEKKDEEEATFGERSSIIASEQDVR